MPCQGRRRCRNPPPAISPRRRCVSSPCLNCRCCRHARHVGTLRRHRTPNPVPSNRRCQSVPPASPSRGRRAPSLSKPQRLSFGKPLASAARRIPAQPTRKVIHVDDEACWRSRQVGLPIHVGCTVVVLQQLSAVKPYMCVPRGEVAVLQLLAQRDFAISDALHRVFVSVHNMGRVQRSRKTER